MDFVAAGIVLGFSIYEYYKYKIKDNNERHYGHYSEFELVTDPNIISEFDDIESRSFL